MSDFLDESVKPAAATGTIKAMPGKEEPIQITAARDDTFGA